MAAEYCLPGGDARSRLEVRARTLARTPGFSLIAIAVMALCIGATTSLFTVVRSVLLRPLPFRDPGRLVMLYEHFRDPRSNQEGFNYNPVSPADFYDWRAQTHGFEDMAAWRWWQFNLTGERGELPELVSAAAAAGTCFRYWACRPASDGHSRRRRSSGRKRRDAYVESFERRFGRIRRSWQADPSRRRSPSRSWACCQRGSPIPMQQVQLWVPYAAGLPPELLQHHDFHFSRVVARLRPDVSLASAMSQVEAVQYRLHMQYLNAPVAEDVAPRTINDDLAQDVKKPLLS